MRLAVTSDLHVPITPTTAITEIARAVAEFSPDALIVAGDVAESITDLEACLSVWKEYVPCPIWVLPGNHDLWARRARRLKGWEQQLLAEAGLGAGQAALISSVELWREALPKTVEHMGCRWLEGTAFLHDGVAMAGTIAWYDYSGADPTIQATPRDFAREKRYFNMDADMIDWPWSDAEFADQVAAPFLATLDRLEADPTVRQVVVVTHVPLLECQMCRKPNNRDWGFSNAYFGNLTLGAQVLERKKVSHVISGHTHVGRDARLTLADGRSIEVHVLASEYGRPKWLGLTIDR
jgi:3',5'-cyclic AMP phosphodiesterase CpdA